MVLIHTYNLTKYDKIQFTDTTKIKAPNSGVYLLQNWNRKYIDRNGNGKIQNFVKSTKNSSTTSKSGATLTPLIWDSFKYIETSSGNHGENVFVSWERSDVIQISKITLYCNGFSFLTKDSLKSMGRFGIQLLF